MKTLIILFVLILLGVTGYNAYQQINGSTDTVSPTVQPGVPGTTIPYNQAQNSVNNYGNKVQNGQNQAQQLQYGN